MTRTLFIFAGAVLLGAFVALVLRSALHRPYEITPATAPSSPMHDEHTPAPAAADPHAGHAAATPARPVNTICAICGMDVDHDLPTATYRNQVIGFACLKCPEKFAKDPERFGPSYLRNEKLTKAEAP